MSPWLCEFAESTFDVPMLCGNIEEIDVPLASLDAVVLMDVLEHFPDPIKSLERIVDTLTDDGIIVIQTPALRSYAKTFEQMKADGEMFLLHMKEDEHLFLFNEKSLKLLFERLGFHYIAFEPPIFAYDMFVFASKQPLKINSSDIIEKWLTADPSRRVVLALLDLYGMFEQSRSKQISQPDVVIANDSMVSQRCLLEVSSELEAIKNSLTWKLSASLRNCCDKFRRLFL